MLKLQASGSAASWLDGRLRPATEGLDGLVPRSFERYLRLLHPASRILDGTRQPITWSNLASLKGESITNDMTWSDVFDQKVLSNPVDDIGDPLSGSVPPNELQQLSEILAAFTSTPDTVWFAVWDGWAGLSILPDTSQPLATGRPVGITRFVSRFQRRDNSRAEGVAATVHLPARDYFLFSGTCLDASQSFTTPPGTQSASMWWPEDRAWFIATEIDDVSTYIGASNECARALLSASDLELVVCRIVA